VGLLATLFNIPVQCAISS